MRVQLPPRSTVRNGQVVEQADTRPSEGRAHRGVRVQVPPWSLPACALSCGPKRRPSEGWSASSTLAWGTVGCLADFERRVYEARLAGSTPARPTGSAGCPPLAPECSPGQALGRGRRL